MRNHTLMKLVVLVAVAGLTLAGCGGSSSSPPLAGETLETGVTLPPVQDDDPTTPQAVFAVPTAINSDNLIVGAAEGTEGGILSAVWWQVDDEGNVTHADAPLAPLGGGTFAAALGLNDNNLIVGVASGERAIAWDGLEALPVALPALSGGGDTAAYAVNNNGRIVGEAENTNGFYRAVYWQRAATGTMTLQGTLPGVPAEWDSAAYAVNSDNIVVGEMIDAVGVSRAVLWRLDGGSYVRFDLPSLSGYQHAAAVGLDNPAEGEPLIVVGEVADNENVRAVLWEVAADWTGSELRDLGAATLDSRAEAVNDHGLVAGWENVQAVVWDDFLPTPLLTTDSQAYDINNQNLVVGRKGSQGFVMRVN